MTPPDPCKYGGLARSVTVMMLAMSNEMENYLFEVSMRLVLVCCGLPVKRVEV